MSHHTPLVYSPCDVPLRRARGAFDVNSIVVHEGILADVWEADRRWRELGGPAFLVIREGDTGSYNCRNSVGHSRAVAIDFNWRSNPYRKPRPPGKCEAQARMEEFFLKCWRPLGYGWGGYWNSACDTMHISKLRREGGNGVLWQTWDHDEEEDMPLTEDDLGKIEQRFRGVLADDGPEITRSAVKKATNLWPGTSAVPVREGERGSILAGDVVWVSASAATNLAWWWTDRDGKQPTEGAESSGGPVAFPVEPPDRKRTLLHVHVKAGGPVTLQVFHRAHDG